MTWTNFAPSTGFTSLRSSSAAAALDLGQNWLSGPLDSSLASLSNAANIGLSVFDNQFSGLIPASFTAFSWLAVAYNPGLVGALPAGFTSSKLFAWSTFRTGYYSWCARLVRRCTPSAALMLSLSPCSDAPPASRAYIYTQGAGITYGGPPTYSSTGGYGTGFLYGTSIGLDRPLTSILLDIKAALDPTGAVLGSWNASQPQPCRPWTSIPGTIGQNPTSPGYGGGWNYISTASTATSADYCLVRGLRQVLPRSFRLTRACLR